MKISITLDAAQLKRELGLTQDEIKKLDGKQIDVKTGAAQSSIGKLRDSLAMWSLALNGAITAAKGLVSAVNSLVAPAMKQESANEGMAAAMRNTNVHSAELELQLRSQASAIQKVTKYGDENILMATAQMQVIGELASDQLPEAQKAAVGLAAKYKFDLNTAFELVGKAAKGNTATLARYGIVLGEGLSQAEKFNELLRQGAEGFALAEAEANTTYGAVEQLNNLWGDFKEMLGNYVLPIVRQLAGALSSLLKVVNRGPSELEGMKTAIIGQRVEFERLVLTYTRLRDTQHRTEEQNQLYKKTIDDLMAKYPNYLRNTDLERGNWDDISLAIDGARTSLQNYINTRIQEAVIQDMENDILEISTDIVKKQAELDELQAAFEAGTKSRTEFKPTAQKTVTDDNAISNLGAYVEATSAAGAKEAQLTRQIEKQNARGKELNETLQKRLSVAQNIYALPPLDEPGGGGGAGSGGSGTAAATKAEISETAKAYEKLLENLRKYHSDSALANLSSHQKELAQLNIKFEEEQQVILNALAAKEITEADAQISLAAIRSKYDAEARQVQKKADDEVIALAQKRIENSVKDEEQYYEMMRFQDDDYYEWKKKKIEDQVMAMAIGNAEKIALIKVFLGELDALKEEYDFTEPAKKGGWFFSGLLGFDPDSPEDQEKLGAMQDTYRNLVSSASGMVSGLVRLSAQRRDQEISDLDAKAAKEGMTNDKLLTQKAEINKKFVDEEKKLKRIQKTIAIGQATINIAEGATKALAMGPIIGPIMAAMVTALGAAQIAIISAQKFASGGLFRGKGGPKDDQNLAYVSDGEYIVNAAATKKHMPLLEMINQAGRYSAGGRVGGTINNAISHSLFPSYGAAAGGASVAPMLNRIIEKIEILNLNLVKKKFTATVQSQGTSPGVREFDLTKHRMEERGYDPSFAQ